MLSATDGNRGREKIQADERRGRVATPSSRRGERGGGRRRGVRGERRLHGTGPRPAPPRPASATQRRARSVHVQRARAFNLSRQTKARGGDGGRGRGRAGPDTRNARTPPPAPLRVAARPLSRSGPRGL